MKYFSLSYWFKLWVLSAPLFNDKTQGINAKSIDNNQKIKDWASNNTNLQSINQYMAFTNSSTNYQPYNLSQTTNETKIITNSDQNKKRVKRCSERDRDCYLRESAQLTIKLSMDWAEQNNQRETNYINSLDPRISFLGSDMKQIGVLWLDTAVNRIKFYPKTYYDGTNGRNSNEQIFGTYKNIFIRDKNDNLIRHITFNTDNFMGSVLDDHNLNSKKVPNDGLDYEDGYTIEITSSPADTTLFKRDECCNWYWNNSKNEHTEKLVIINNWLWHNNYYQEKYFSLLVDWKNKVKNGRNDSYEWILQHLFDYKHVMQTIQNTIAIDNLKTEISQIYNKISQLETQIRNLQNKSINGLSACSSTAGAINNINGALKVASTAFSFIPVFGQGISAVISLTSSACALAGAYGRKRRDVFTTNIKNKFDDNFIKSINQEQHLPPITNNNNYIANNITNL
ncbi:hypothetical protein [Spiroplasma ixodetis]|uniref:Uncharacterized protein n=1 Tax=Spiroplasma ixodetis TaxID=2141 RepID=A0ABM8JQG8_9MOLU